MLIPLGFWAASGASTAPSAAYELISTATGTGSSGVITFSSIPQTYKHLQIRAVSKNSAGSTTTHKQIQVTFNGVTTASYAAHRLRADGTSVVSENATAQAFIPVTYAAASSTTANVFGAAIFDILDYANSTTNKTLRVLSGGIDNYNNISLQSGFCSATTAISSLTFTIGSLNFATGTRFSLYGIKG